MKVNYIEKLERWVTVEIPEEGLKGEELEAAANEVLWEYIAMNGWDGETIHESFYEEELAK